MDAIRLSPDDNVATLLRAAKRGERLEIGGGAGVEAADDIPLCHKIALVALQPGDRIRKYGETIGEATAAIQPGAHVHIHNLRSLRARAR
ncbi:MAG: hydrolase [Alphaproteobacteria bacterium]|nr:hydrolase [Alphaproteobacteria bacterium]